MRLAISKFEVCINGARIVQMDEACIAGPGWFGVLGANGSGKTTLLRALAGRLRQIAGTVTLDGTPIDRDGRIAAIGFAPAIETLPDEITGLDVLTLAARATRARLDAPHLADLRRVLGLESFWSRRIRSYSAGMKQRLSIYAAFVGGQAIVILDEPFNWLDPVVAFDTKEVLRELASGDMLLITALHDLATLANCCDKGFVMANGTVRLPLPPDVIQSGKQDVSSFERRIIASIRAG